MSTYQYPFSFSFRIHIGIRISYFNPCEKVYHECYSEFYCDQRFEDFIHFGPPYSTNISSSTIIQVHLYPASYYLIGGVIGSQSNMYVLLTFDICTTNKNTK